MTAPNFQVTLEELSSIALFAALEGPVLSRLSSSLRGSLPEAGEVIFREGDAANAMFVVLQGEVEVLKRSRRGSDTRVAVLGPGDWFGEMSLVDVQPRSATVRVLAPARLLHVTAADLDMIYRSDLRAYAIIVLNLARGLSRRLRVADGILVDLVASLCDHYLNRPGLKR